ncbi:hypothetical protein ACXIT0_24890 [Methylorubrum extorquens]
MSSLTAARNAAMADFITASGQWAITLAYNNHRPGTSGPCYRITSEGECLRIGGSGIAAHYGINRLAGARRISLEQVHRDLDRLHARVDRKLFGCRFNELPGEQRTAFVGFVEHARTNLHVHLTWRVPETRAEEFVSVIAEAWRATGPAATIDVQPIRDAGWGRYVTKDQWGAALDDAALFVASRPAAR